MTTFTRRHVLIALSAMPACGLPTVDRADPGVHELADKIRGVKRRSLLFVPPGLGGPAPMVVGLPDGWEAPEGELLRWRQICEAEGWVGLFPDYPKDGYGDDNTNLTHLVQRATAMGGVDPRRRVVAGHGAGGHRAYALAASHSGLLAAVATSGAVLAFADRSPTPELPGVSVLHLHGGRDEIVSVDGGPLGDDPEGRKVVPIQQALGPWIHLVGGPATPTVEGTSRRWAGPKHVVELVVEPEQGHARVAAQTEAMRSFFRARFGPS